MLIFWLLDCIFAVFSFIRATRKGLGLPTVGLQHIWKVPVACFGGARGVLGGYPQRVWGVLVACFEGTRTVSGGYP